MKVPFALVFTISTLLTTTYAAPTPITPQVGDLANNLNGVSPSLTGSATPKAASGLDMKKRGLFGSEGILPKAARNPATAPAKASTQSANEEAQTSEADLPKVESTREGYDAYQIMKRGLFGPSGGFFPKAFQNPAADSAKASTNSEKTAAKDEKGAQTSEADLPKVESTREGYDAYQIMKRGLFGPSGGFFPKAARNPAAEPAKTSTQSAKEGAQTSEADLPKVESTREGYDAYQIMKRGLFGPSGGFFSKGFQNPAADPAKASTKSANTAAKAKEGEQASEADLPKVESTREGFDAYQIMKRDINPHVDAIVNTIVNINTKIVAKVLSDLSVQLSSDIRTKLTVFTKGLLPIKVNILIPKISSRVDEETKSAISSKVETDAKDKVLDNIHDHTVDSILKRCPKADDECILAKANDIIADVEALVKVDVEHLFIALKLNLMTHVRSHVAVKIRELAVNLPLEPITIQGDVDAVAELDLHLSTCSHIIVKELDVTVVANAIAIIKGILGN